MNKIDKFLTRLTKKKWKRPKPPIAEMERGISPQILQIINEKQKYEELKHINATTNMK